ncbi:MAG: hypothetical protein AB2421_13310 [Thermotaleaceae bacterium]
MERLDLEKINGFMELLGGSGINEEQLYILEEISEIYTGKKEEDILNEMAILYMMIQENPENYQKQREILQQIKLFLNEGQKKKLDDIMSYLQDHTGLEKE